jgi:hypothetical protein
MHGCRTLEPHIAGRAIRGPQGTTKLECRSRCPAAGTATWPGSLPRRQTRAGRLCRFSGRPVQHRPTKLQRLDQLRAISAYRGSWPVRRPRPRCRLPQRPTGMIAMPTVELGQLIQDRRLLSTRRLHILAYKPVGDLFTYPTSNPSTEGCPRAYSDESTNRFTRASWMSQRGSLTLGLR